MKILLLVLLGFLLLALGPLVTIWAWNTLFTGSTIPYTFGTWVAVIILGAFFRANVSVKK